ncbi:DUF7673 family protein [Thauera propionica]|uniref:DUF7673 family protein n=1 Tax=Thauera propionica TaxID=2019431 RepID=UPI0023F4F1D1|nr:hypothetical protein [Thauera propionica]MDD3675813.1 hypothetical protein [Thauera propionica]
MSTVTLNPMPACRRDDGDEDVTVRMTMPKSRLAKLQTLMDADTWEKAQAARDLKLSECHQSIGVLFNTQRRHLGTTGGRVCATLLASLYNGERVKFDVSDLRCLDEHLFEHAMNTMRLCYELNAEPHTFFSDGGRLFEEMIERWGLEKKRRRVRT